MKAFLIIAVLTAGNGFIRHSTEVPTMEECLKLLDAVVIELAQPSEDNESAVVAYCSYENLY